MSPGMALPLTQVVKRILSSVHGTALLLFPYQQLISVSILRSVNNFSELTKVTPMGLLRASALHSVLYGQQYSFNYLASTEAPFQMMCKTISSIKKIDICSF
jgi:hypothetical protein